MAGLDENVKARLGMLTDREVAELAGCSTFKITYWRRKLGIARRGKAKQDPDNLRRRREIEEHIIEHQDMTLTARTFGISRQRVHQIAIVSLHKVWVPVSRRMGR